MSKAMRVLIIDDSVAFRLAIKAALVDTPGIEVVGTAANGKVALGKLQDKATDVVILDMEMPEMDGLETLRAMRKMGFTTRVILFAAPTPKGYERVQAAMASGADDFLAKPGAGGDSGAEAAVGRIRAELLPKLLMLAGATKPESVTTKAPRAVGPVTWPKRDLDFFKPDAIVIASSTGGPMALERMFAALKAPITRPVLMVQHMPPPFTANLATRLSELSGVSVREGHDGEVVKSGHVYIAPAGFHMVITGSKFAPVLRVYTGPRINFVIPAADPLFTTAATMFGTALMGFVLTGMGEDGKAGAVDVKNAGGGMMIQDEATAVVWGMPGAVHAAGAADRVASLDDCAKMFARMAL